MPGLRTRASTRDQWAVRRSTGSMPSAASLARWAAESSHAQTVAPLHHHFEKKGWAEPTIVIRFWIIASILALAGLSTLKLR